MGVTFAQAVALASDHNGWVAEVAEGWDVFGIPHGGYLMGLSASAALHAVALPDVLSISTHFLRRAQHGPMRLTVTTEGESRRFTSVGVRAHQDERLVTSSLVLLGDRSQFHGPRWSSRIAPSDIALGPEAGDPDLPFPPPDIAKQLRLRLAVDDTGFAVGKPTGRASITARMEVPGDVDAQLAAIVGADITPPAVWNALGPTGWVPTVEMSAQLRARPAPGPLWVRAETTEVADGFLDEAAEVYDDTGRLVLLSTQHARVPNPVEPQAGGLR